MYLNRRREIGLFQEQSATKAFNAGAGARARLAVKRKPNSPAALAKADLEKLKRLIDDYRICLTGPRVLRYWVRASDAEHASWISGTTSLFPIRAVFSSAGHRLCMGKCVDLTPPPSLLPLHPPHSSPRLFAFHNTPSFITCCS